MISANLWQIFENNQSLIRRRFVLITCMYICKRQLKVFNFGERKEEKIKSSFFFFFLHAFKIVDNRSCCCANIEFETLPKKNERFIT